MQNLSKNEPRASGPHHTLTNQMFIPFSGAAKHSTYNRTYNFYLSQLGIQIKLAFGCLTTKWRIFWRNLDFSLEKNSLICEIAAKLDNYVIDNDNIVFGEAEHVEDLVINVIEGGPVDKKGYIPNLHSKDKDESVCEQQQQNIVDELVSREMKRPLHNLLRNNELDDITAEMQQ